MNTFFKISSKKRIWNKQLSSLFANKFKPNFVQFRNYVKQEKTLLLNVSGMKCGGCVKKVEDAIYKQDNKISKVSANFVTGIVSITYNAETLPHDFYEKMNETIEKLGFTVSQTKPFSAQQRTDVQEESSFSKIRNKLLVSLTCGLPVITLSMTEMLLHKHILPPNISNWVQLILATPVVLYGASSFFKRAFKLLKSFQANMDTLVSTGVGVSYIWSVVVTLLDLSHTYPVYFETSAMITLLVLVGRFLEAKAKVKTTEAIDALYKLQPKYAKVLINPNSTKEVKQVPIEELREGDLVLVVPGEYISADGIVVQGSTFVDESMLTGESFPQKKSIGSTVIAGTINYIQQNKEKDDTHGSIVFRVTKFGENTALANIIKSVQMAQSTKLSNMQTLADRVSAVFSGFIITFAALTAIGWSVIGAPLNIAISTAVAVLVISCPCAVGLAFPTAITVSTGKLAKNGILIRNVQIFEKLASGINIAIFDKTGTLTEGKPKVQDFIPLSKNVDKDLFGYVAALEERSEHPLAKALVAYCREKDDSSFDVMNFKSSTSGLIGTINEHEVICGKMEFVFEKINANEQDCQIVKQKVNEISSEAKTPVLVAIDNDIKGIFCIFDKLKPNVSQVLKQLKKRGITTVLLTGDRTHVAEAIAKEINEQSEEQVMSSVVASVLPEQKLEFIQNLQSKKLRVMMIGDGINDSPALSQADVGIALATGADIAAKSADVVIMNGDIEKILEMEKISKDTMKIIKQNLWWAFGYNIFAIPMASLNLLHPMFASALMSVSSICVVSNSLRLKK